jgi:hypothetical protein
MKGSLRSASSAAASAVTRGQFVMAVDQRAAMPRNMLDHADHAAARSPSITARPSAATRIGSAPRCAVAHDVACPRLPHVEQRQRNRR